MMQLEVGDEGSVLEEDVVLNHLETGLGLSQSVDLREEESEASLANCGLQVLYLRPGIFQGLSVRSNELRRVLHVKDHV